MTGYRARSLLAPDVSTRSLLTTCLVVVIVVVAAVVRSCCGGPRVVMIGGRGLTREGGAQREHTSPQLRPSTRRGAHVIIDSISRQLILFKLHI